MLFAPHILPTEKREILTQQKLIENAGKLCKSRAKHWMQNGVTYTCRVKRHNTVVFLALINFSEALDFKKLQKSQSFRKLLKGTTNKLLHRVSIFS